jgi:hypothetical protein
MQDLSVSKLRHIGKTGIYIDLEQITNNLRNWNENTPDYLKKEQVENLAGVGILACIGLLFIASLIN